MSNKRAPAFSYSTLGCFDLPRLIFSPPSLVCNPWLTNQLPPHPVSEIDDKTSKWSSNIVAFPRTHSYGMIYTFWNTNWESYMKTPDRMSGGLIWCVFHRRHYGVLAVVDSLMKNTGGTSSPFYRFSKIVTQSRCNCIVFVNTSRITSF